MGFQTPWAGQQSITWQRQRRTTIHNYYPTSGQFRVTSPASLHVFGFVEETGAPAGNPHRHREDAEGFGMAESE